MWEVTYDFKTLRFVVERGRIELGGFTTLIDATMYRDYLNRKEDRNEQFAPKPSTSELLQGERYEA